MSIVLTREQVRRVDHLAIDRYGIAGIVLMENAGRSAADLIRESYGGVTPTDREFAQAEACGSGDSGGSAGAAGRAFIACGPGNNGGDGCVIARHLHNAGWSVRLMITGDKSQMTPDTLTNYRIVEAMGIERSITADFAAQEAIVETVQVDEVIVDALLGTGFRGRVRSPTAELIEKINAARRRGLVAVDVPSGLDCDTGVPSNAVIVADLTITFVAEKTGFSSQSAARCVGRVEVVDIGAPRELVAEVLSESTG